jgi:prepilin-type N-terminal cleavage/methylation domain-containing protein
MHVPLFSRSAALGFTMIELLVSVSILVLLMGGGIAGFINLNDRQTLVNSGKEVQLMMRSAQKKARVGEKPTGCDRLVGYSVVVGSGSFSEAELRAECDNGSYVRQTYVFPNNVIVENAVSMRFVVLHGGVEGAGTVSITFGTRRLSFDVGKGGDISEVVLTTIGQ